MAISAVEQEVRTVTGVKPKGKEDRAKFLSRLAEGLQKISDDAWDNMSKGGQDWANLATKAYDNDKPVKEFAVEEEEDEESEVEAAAPDDDAEEEETPPARGRKAAKAAPPKPAPKAAAKGKPGPKPAKSKPAKERGNGAERVLVGVKVDIKKMIIKNPDITADEIMEGLRKHPPASQPDYVPSKFTVTSIGSEFRHSLRVLKQEGVIDIEL
jgi:hypothetical protein